ANAVDELRKNYPERFAELEYESKLTDDLNKRIEEQINLIQKRAFVDASMKAYEQSLLKVQDIQNAIIRQASGEQTFGDMMQGFFNPLQWLPVTIGERFEELENQIRSAEEAMQDALYPGQRQINSLEKIISDRQ